MFGLFLDDDTGRNVIVPSFEVNVVVNTGSRAQAAVEFRSDGRIFASNPNGGAGDSGFRWLLTGLPADYYLSREVYAGFPDTTLDTDAGDLQQMNQTLTYAIETVRAGRDVRASIRFSISDDASGNNVIASGNIGLNAILLTQTPQGGGSSPPGVEPDVVAP